MDKDKQWCHYIYLYSASTQYMYVFHFTSLPRVLEMRMLAVIDVLLLISSTVIRDPPTVLLMITLVSTVYCVYE